MSAWTLVRDRARAFHRSLVAEDALMSATMLLERAITRSGVALLKVPPGDPLLDGGEACYDAAGPRIFVSTGLSPEDFAFHVAHELGHHDLHRQKVACQSEDIDPTTPASPTASLVGDEDDYNPKERMEAQANLFAREFLLPSDKLRDLCAAKPTNALELTATLGVSRELVRHQMADTFLLPTPDERAKRSHPPTTPDKSQQEAAEAPLGPVLVRAGPGTGKTKTLVSRIRHLLDTGVAPDRILALTYSNDSSVDLADRVRNAAPEQAALIWAGTFHAFGLELLRKFGSRIGLPMDVRLLDRAASLLKMETLLSELKLDYFLDVYEPLRGLKGVLNAIGRAKDELCSPTRYAELAEAMKIDGASESDAAKAAEVAHAFAVYDAACRKDGVVDYGDLIARSVELLTLHADVREQVRSTYEHILVDEYQDMNAASRQLLKLLVGKGRGPWVVGDVRQSIYRFRGASPLNITRFSSDFDDAKVLDLGTNYRSYREVVDTFGAFGKTMAGASLASGADLHAERGPGGSIEYRIAATREAESNGVAETIAAHIAAGGRARDHAVLGRSHSILVRIAEQLEHCHIPCLYFGNFFERPEIRDLLSLLSVASEFQGVGIVRLAGKSPFSIPKTDVIRVFEYRKEKSISMLDALRSLADIQGLSEVGRQGLSRLADVLADVSFVTPAAEVISAFLFDFGALWQPGLSEQDVSGQQRRLAVYQFLQLALNVHKRPHGKDPKRAFLKHVRTLELLDEEKELRKPPSAAADIDAVQIMTVHASKGLEFPIVHIPALSPSYFPASPRPQPCPPPPGLVPADPVMSHDAEEDGLFFVALSRAQNALHLSRALRYGGSPRPNPSRFLDVLGSRLKKSVAGKADWTSEGLPSDPWPALGPPALPMDLAVHALETYLECPRRYYYQELLGIRSLPHRQPHVQMMSCVRAGLRHLREHGPDEVEKVSQAFQETWDTMGPVDHPLATTYRGLADRMLTYARAAMRGTPLPSERSFQLGTTKIGVNADHVFAEGSLVVIQRLKMGRLAKKNETLKPRYAMLQATVRADTGSNVVFEHVSLLDGNRRTETPSYDAIEKIRDQLQGALDGIAAGRFDPSPSERNCPSCPFFFACPATP
jgi:superfamily I DNA/RNA helicase